MRKCVLVMWVVACLYISGCGFADYLAGIERDEKGQVVKVQGGIAEIGAGLLVGTGGAAGAAGGLLGWLLKAYRHKRIVDAGGKDDDFDGHPDPESPKPPVAPTV
jgi:hypothetical protein